MNSRSMFDHLVSEPRPVSHPINFPPLSLELGFLFWVLRRSTKSKCVDTLYVYCILWGCLLTYLGAHRFSLRYVDGIKVRPTYQIQIKINRQYHD